MQIFNDDNPTTRTRMILAEMRRIDEERRKQIEKHAKELAEGIDAFRREAAERDARKAGVLVRLWSFVKKVLSYANGEADKIHLEK